MSGAAAAAATGRVARSNNIPGFGGGILGGQNRGGLMGMTSKLLNQARARRAARKAGAVGSASASVGGDGGRLDSIESRVTALEGGGESNSVAGAAGVKTGGEGFQDMATVTSGTMPEAPQVAGSLQEAMPGPAEASMDMFGSEFARNSAVGAAKMIKNKNI